MRGSAEADLQETITDRLFIQPKIAVGSSVAITKIVVTSQIAGLENTPCFYPLSLSFFEKYNTFDRLRHCHLIVIAEVGVRLIKISKYEN